MTNQCANYEEAQEAFRAGELQFWDGKQWLDLPVGDHVFFGRDPHDYRRRPTPQEAVPVYFVWYAGLSRGERIRCFGKASEVANYLWGKDLRDCAMFKRVLVGAYDLKEIERILENT